MPRGKGRGARHVDPTKKQLTEDIQQAIQQVRPLLEKQLEDHCKIYIALQDVMNYLNVAKANNLEGLELYIGEYNTLYFTDYPQLGKDNTALFDAYYKAMDSLLGSYAPLSTVRYNKLNLGLFNSCIQLAEKGVANSEETLKKVEQLREEVFKAVNEKLAENKLPKLLKREGLNIAKQPTTFLSGKSSVGEGAGGGGGEANPSKKTSSTSDDAADIKQIIDEAIQLNTNALRAINDICVSVSVCEQWLGVLSTEQTLLQTHTLNQKEFGQLRTQFKRIFGPLVVVISDILLSSIEKGITYSQQQLDELKKESQAARQLLKSMYLFKG